MNVKKAKALRRELGFNPKAPREYVKEMKNGIEVYVKPRTLVEGSLRKLYKLAKKEYKS